MIHRRMNRKDYDRRVTPQDRPYVPPSNGFPNGDACGCGPCISVEDVTIDFGAEWDAAETYKLHDGTELTWNVTDSCWYGPTFTRTCDESEVTVRYRFKPVGTAVEEAVLELVIWDTGGSSVAGVISTYKNTISMWKPHCPTWLFLIEIDFTDCPEFTPSMCMFCISPQKPLEGEGE